VSTSQGKKSVEHCHVVDSEEYISVHFFNFKHVINVGSRVVLASVAFTSFDEWLCGVLVLLFR